MKLHLLVFDDGSSPEIDLQGFIDTLDEAAEMHTLDGHVCFIRSTLSVSELSQRFRTLAGSSLFFVTELNAAHHAGRMPEPFWKFVKETAEDPALEHAAE